jgi:hypothetical protein
MAILDEHQKTNLLNSHENIDTVMLIESKGDYLMIGFYQDNDLEFVQVFEADYLAREIGSLGTKVYTIENNDFDSCFFYEMVNAAFDATVMA